MLGKKFFILLFITLIWGLSDSFGSSDIPKYYTQEFVQKYNKGSLADDELKEELFNIISLYHLPTKSRDVISPECPDSSKCYTHQGNFSYGTARKILFGQLHIEKDKYGVKLTDVYCEKEFTSADGIGEDQIPNAARVNCEHTWPQSKFTSKFSKNMQKVDLHHLFPSDSISNSTRSNHIFSEVDGDYVNGSCKTSRLGKSLISRETAFEPPLNHRGNVARAMFYFSTRYKIKIDPVQEEYFRKWHQEDPVDDKEIKRNNRIFEFQKNRNPYIDMPDLVDMISNF